MPVLSETVDGLQGLLEKVLSIGRELPEGRFLWFRGLNCANHALLPKLLRDGKSAKEIFDREVRLLTRFRQRSMAYWPSGYPQNNWEHLFAMQHFGMPTRLLDWSENLYVAVYFALGEASGHGHDGACVPTLWCMDPIEWNQNATHLSDYGSAIGVLTTADDDLEPYEPNTSRRRNSKPVAMFGAHNSGRIVAQRGTFVVWGEKTLPLDEVADNARIWKIQISGVRASLRSDLRILGFSETMVFPELPSLAIELAQSVSWRTIREE